MENINKSDTRKTYKELSKEFTELFPSARRAFELIPLMYNRLTLVDGFAHKDAITRIRDDHKHLSGFTSRNIYRFLPSDNPQIPRRVVTPRHKKSNTKEDDTKTFSGTELDAKSRANGEKTNSQNNVKESKAYTETMPEENSLESPAIEYPSYYDLAKSELIKLHQKKDQKVAFLERQHYQDGDKILELRKALKQASFKPANQFQPIQYTQIVLNLDQYRNDLLALIQDKKPLCYIMVDRVGNVIELKTEGANLRVLNTNSTLHEN